jgi:manganese/iron transport system permease protein/iron/zinc/copper transport system permease protein
MNVVGVTLIAAAIVIPPSTARLLTNSFGRMIVLSCLFGSLSGGIGMFLSFHLDISSGSAIVLLAASTFAVVYAGTTLRSALAYRRQLVNSDAPERARIQEEPLP